MAAQNAAVERASGEIVAFSDANTRWEPDALRALVSAFDDGEVGYACGQLVYLDPEGDNEEGAYWRLEMGVRELESGLGGITAGNGGIYAVRRADYIPLPPSRSHDLSFPFLLAKRGRRSVYVPAARASERMVPTLEGEFARKRRMMVGIPDIVGADGMWDPRGYSPLYAFEILSHRVLRYASPLLHALAFAANLVLLGRGRVYRLALAAQLGLAGAALAGGPGSPAPTARSPATTRSSPPRSRSAAWTAGATARPPPGRSRKGRGERRGGRPRRLRGPARDRCGAAGGRRPRTPTPSPAAACLAQPTSRSRSPGCSSSPRCCCSPRSRSGSPPGPRDLPAAAGRARRPRVRPAQAADDGRRQRSGRSRHRGRRRRPAGDARRRDPPPHLPRRGPQPGQRPARGDGDRRAAARRSPPTSSTTPPISTAATPCARASRAGPRSTGGVGISWGERIELDSWYVEHRSPRLDLTILARTVKQVLRGEGLDPG